MTESKIFCDLDGVLADFEPNFLRKWREAHPDSTADQQIYVNYNRYPMEGAGYAQTKLNLNEIINF